MLLWVRIRKRMRKMMTVSTSLSSIPASVIQIRLLYGYGNANENRSFFHYGNKKSSITDHNTSQRTPRQGTYNESFWKANQAARSLLGHFFVRQLTKAPLALTGELRLLITKSTLSRIYLLCSTRTRERFCPGLCVVVSYCKRLLSQSLHNRLLHWTESVH